MKIVNLMEDTPGSKGCLYEHGLSFYIETPKHKILLDTGTTAKTLGNADKLGIDITLTDTIVLSHGHYDHTGGVLAVVERNPDVCIYMQKSAGLDYYHLKDEEQRYIGIDKAILKLPQLKLLEGDFRIDDELSIFSKIQGRRLWPKGNLSLKRKVGEKFEQDIFEHEQCLVIAAEGKQILLSGCAHNGILNILERYSEIYHAEPDVVISGFHMMQKTPYTEEDIHNIKATAEELSCMHTKFYTGHCTGMEAFSIMKEIMGEQLVFVHSGDEIEIK